MKVGLIVDPYGEKMPGGLGRAIWELAQALVAEGSHDYTVYLKRTPAVPPALPPQIPVVSLESKRLFLDGARRLDKTLDAYVFFTPVIPLLFFPKRAVVVVHDFAYLELPHRTLSERVAGFGLYLLHYVSLRKAAKVVAVSKFTKECVMRHFRIPSERIEVAYNGFVPFHAKEEPLEVPEHFFLFAGVLKERKNVHGVIKAFAQFAGSHPEYVLLIAGKKGGDYFASLQRLAKELGVGESVKFLGYVTDGQLAYLYKKAKALVFPSFIEGFGMPVLEAMEAGLPVITSNEGALAEVAGNAALLANPHDPSAIAAGMEELLDSSRRQACIEKGKIRVVDFSWQTQASKLSHIIYELK